MQIAIIGAGNVGGALGKGWARSGHVIDHAVPDPSDDKHRVTAEAAGGAGLFSVARAVQRAAAIVLAVPFDAVASALDAAGNLAGRLLIDVTNPLRMGAAGLELSLGFDWSAAEHVASLSARCGGVQNIEPGRVRSHGEHGRLRCAAGDVRGRRRCSAQARGNATRYRARLSRGGRGRFARPAPVGALWHVVDSHGA